MSGDNKDFVSLCKKLEEFQYNMIPILKEKDYELTSDLKEVVGFVLYVDNVAVGSIGLKKVSDDACEIVRVFISEEYRGNGYARYLFENIEKLAREMGYRKAEMVAWTKAKSALRLYEKLGYEKSEEKVSEWFAWSKYVELFKNL